MASSSSMLTFPVGFDFSGAIKDSEIKKALDRAEKIVKGKPIVVTADFDRSGLDRLEFYYDETIRKIQNRISKLSKAWDKIPLSDRYTADKSDLSSIATNIGTKAKPEMLSPKQIFAEWEQLTMLLQLAGKTLSQIHQERMKNMSDEERALQRQQKQIEQETAARTRQAEIIGRLNDKILSSQIAREDTSRQVTAITKATDAYAAQDKVVQRLEKDLLAQLAAKTKLESTGKAYNKDGTQTKAYTDVLQRELELTKQLTTAEAELTARYERQFQLLKQIGLSANQTPLGALAANPAASAAIDAQITKYNQLKAQINAVTADFERLKALQLQAGGTGYEDIINQKLKLRAQLEKELAKTTQTAEQAQAKMLREQEALTAKITARKQAQIAKQAQEQRQIQQRIAALKQERAALVLKENTLANIQKKLAATQALLQKTDFVGDPAKFKRLQEEIERLSQKLQNLSGKQEKAKKAAESHAKGLEYQKGVLDRLIQRMAVYASFGAVVGFAQKVREVTAQFELQRISLGAIIQDQARANQLFSEIKQFALKSPIKILDLTKYTKQVAAYRIETDKLFDTTKRLADVSVGLGVDMQRLVLAYGQVKAATYLRASELRQFTEAGIPMLELLSERFTQLEGQMVSTADVMKRISKRGVEFKDVEQVFNDMTSAGGMFYNMQEKQGNTLYGMWAKLGDAAAIMYDEIGNTSVVNAGMKATIRMLSDMMRNWRSLAREIGMAVAAFAIYKLFIQKLTIDEARFAAATKASAAARVRHNAAMATGGKLTQFTTRMTRLAAIAEMQAATATTLWARAWHSLKAAMLSNPIMAAVLAITLLAEKLYTAYENATKLENALKEIDVENTTEQNKSVRNFESLAELAVNAADGSKKQRDALEELQRTYKDMIPIELLTIENLRSMNHEYGELTKSIRMYIQEQMKKKAADTVMENYGRDIVDQERSIQKYLENMGLSQSQAGKFLFEYSKVALDSTKTLKEKVAEAFKSVGIEVDKQDEEFQKKAKRLYQSYKTGGDISFRRDAKLKELTKLYNDQEDALNGLEARYSSAGNELGRFQEQYEKITKTVNEATYKMQGGEALDMSSFLGQQAKRNAEIKQMEKLLKESLGGAWSEGMSEIVTNIDAGKAEIISALDFTAILEAARKKNDPELIKLVETMQKRYDEMVPSDSAVKVMRARFDEIVHSFGFTVDRFHLLYMQNDEDVEAYVKRLNDKKDALTKQIDGIKSALQKAAKIKVFSETIFKRVAGGLEESLKKAEDEMKVVDAMLNDLPSFDKDKKTGGTKSDPRLQILNEMAGKMAEINKEYAEMMKWESQVQAFADTQERFASTFEDMQKTADKYHFKLPKFETPKTVEDVQKWYKAIQDEIRRLNLKDADKVLIELGVKADKLGMDELQRQIEEQLKKLQSEIAQSKAAKDFFDNIFSQSKDYDMAVELTMSVYGDTGENYQQQIIDQIRTAFGAGQDWEIDITPAIDVRTKQVNYNILEDLMEKALQNEDLEKYREQMRKIISELRKFDETQVKQWAKDLQQAKTYASETVELSRWTATQKLKIEQQLAQRIATIRYNYQYGNIDAKTAKEQIEAAQKAADNMMAGYDLRQQQLQQNLDFDFLKKSALYTTAFDNLDSLSRTTLEKMRERLVALRTQMAETLTPDQYAEFTNKIQSLDEQLAKRNPIKQLVKNWKEYIKILRKKDVKKTEQDMIENETKLTAASAKLKKALKEESAAEAALNKARTSGDNNEIKAAEEILRDKKKTVEETQKEVDGLEKVKSKLQEIIGAYNNAKSVVAGAAQQVSGFISGLGTAAEGLAKWTEIFGGDEEDVQFFQDIADGLNGIAGGVDQIVQAAMSGNVGGVIGGVIAAPANMVQGFIDIFSAGKVKKANKEIKRQQERLEALARSFEHLSDATDKTFGSDYIANYNQRLENLQSQQAAYMKQAEAERSKGKKADKDKIKEYEDAARDAADEIIKMQNEVAETLAGTDVASAARDFASAWLDAYISFESTTQAIKEKFNDMVKNMIIESAMGQIAQAVLDPFYKKIKDAALSGGKMEAYELVNLANEIPQYTDQISDGLQIFANTLESLGMDLHDLGDSGEFTGIAREIASASEESITGLAAMINTQNYYISNVPLIYQEVVLIRQLLSGENPAGVSRSPMLDTADLQNEYLSHLPAIHTNTEAIAERCERAAAACENMADKLDRVITPNGVNKGYAVVIS